MHIEHMNLEGCFVVSAPSVNNTNNKDPQSVEQNQTITGACCAIKDTEMLVSLKYHSIICDN